MVVGELGSSLTNSLSQNDILIGTLAEWGQMIDGNSIPSIRLSFDITSPE